MSESSVSNSNVVKEFSRFAHAYNQYNVIQVQVAKYLLSTLEEKHYNTVIDMGCGAGEIYINLKKTASTFDSFIAIDSSSEMLGLHPTYTHIEKRCENFNEREAFTKLYLEDKDIFISSSALQWSKDLDFTFSNLVSQAPHIHLSLFTSATFQTLHKTANITSPIYSAQTLQTLISNYYEAHYEIKNYRLYFKSTREMFRYIKKSGVSGGEKRLSFQEGKKLMNNYPLEYLEFEVLFVRGKRKKN